MQSCLGLLGQHSIEFSAVQYYLKGIKTTLDRVFFSVWVFSGNNAWSPKSIKATLHRIFFHLKLYRASRTTLHRVLTCAVWPQEY